MKKWDIFISHASENRKEIAEPLMNYFLKKEIKVWIDLIELELGDSLIEKIEDGLSNSTYGVVIISHAFLQKRWTKRELSGLFSLEESGEKIILPVWHEITKREVATYSPILADRIAIDSASGIESIGEQIIRIVHKNSIKEKNYQNLMKIFLDLKKSPSVFILLYCILKENIQKSSQILAFGNGDDIAGFPVFAKDYYSTNKESFFIKYGIGGGFKDGLNLLLSEKLIIGIIDNFEINPKYKHDIAKFFEINERIVTSMIELSRTEDTNKQYFREDTPLGLKELLEKVDTNNYSN